jgi:hypothetical protein
MGYTFITHPPIRCPRRAEKARRALRLGNYRNHDRRAVPEDVTDILADLRHLCDKRGWDFGNLDRIVYDHYLTEKGWRR